MWTRSCSSKEAAENSNRTDSREAVHALIHRDADALVLVMDDQLIVGSLVVGWDGWRCHPYRFAVRPDYRRRGIGTALLKRAEGRFLAFGGARADAMVLNGNDSRPSGLVPSGLRTPGPVVPVGQAPHLSMLPVAAPGAGLDGVLCREDNRDQEEGFAARTPGKFARRQPRPGPVPDLDPAVATIARD